MSSHLTSTGRGGAGNIGDVSQSPKIQPKDLETPVLKQSVVTTGRGGSGNMHNNTDPNETRALQDVGPVMERQHSDGVARLGRGGAANIVKMGSEEPEAASKNDEPAAATAADEKTKNHDHGSLASKGKEWLFGKKS